MQSPDDKPTQATPSGPPTLAAGGRTRTTQTIDPKGNSTWTKAGDNKYHATGTKLAGETVKAFVFQNGNLISTGQAEAVVDVGMDWRFNFPNVNAGMTVDVKVEFDDGNNVVVEQISNVTTN